MAFTAPLHPSALSERLRAERKVPFCRRYREIEHPAIEITGFHPKERQRPMESRRNAPLFIKENIFGFARYTRGDSTEFEWKDVTEKAAERFHFSRLVSLVPQFIGYSGMFSDGISKS